MQPAKEKLKSALKQFQVSRRLMKVEDTTTKPDDETTDQWVSEVDAEAV